MCFQSESRLHKTHKFKKRHVEERWMWVFWTAPRYNGIFHFNFVSIAMSVSFGIIENRQEITEMLYIYDRPESIR